MSTIHAVHIDDKDSCVTVTEPVKAGDTVEYHLADGTVETVTALGDSPIYQDRHRGRAGGRVRL